MAFTIPWNLIAATVSGDFGDVSIYTDRFQKKVVYPKAPPDKPPSPLQVVQRGRFKAAQQAYIQLSQSDKDLYEEIVRLGSCCLTGQNLFIKVSLRRDFAALQTLREQTGVNVPDPPVI